MPAVFDTTKLFKKKDKGSSAPVAASPLQTLFDAVKGPLLGGSIPGMGGLGGSGLAGSLGSLGSKDWKGLEKFLLGYKPRVQPYSLLNPYQQGLQQDVGQFAMQGLQNPYAGFAPIEQRARSQFQQQTLPSIAERFASLSGGMSSPAFASQLGQAGAGLEESLAALASQYGLQREGNLSQLLGLGLRPSQENILFPGGSGLLGGFSQSFGPGLGSAFGSALMKYLI